MIRIIEVMLIFIVGVFLVLFIENTMTFLSNFGFVGVIIISVCEYLYWKNKEYYL